MEFAQRPRGPLAAASPSGFNPCFCGIRSTAPRIRSACHLCSGSVFNPCFCGIRSTASLGRCHRLARYRFQSLFLWNSLNGSASIAPSLSRHFSWFQSLFLWNSLNGITRLITPFWPSQFQSLFLWNSLNGFEIVKGYALPHGVSILVFVEFARRPPVPPSLSSVSFSFNPCFCGIRSTARCIVERRSQAKRFQSLFLWNSLNGAASLFIQTSPSVSILVFVEFAQRRVPLKAP